MPGKRTTYSATPSPSLPLGAALINLEINCKWWCLPWHPSAALSPNSPLVKKAVQFSVIIHTTPLKRKALAWVQNRFKAMLTTVQITRLHSLSQLWWRDQSWFYIHADGMYIDYGRKWKMEFSVSLEHEPSGSRVTIKQYNSIITTIPTLEHSDCAFRVVNEAIYAMSQKSHSWESDLHES